MKIYRVHSANYAKGRKISSEDLWGWDYEADRVRKEGSVISQLQYQKNTSLKF